MLGNITLLLSLLPSLSSPGLPDLAHPPACFSDLSHFLLLSHDSTQLKHTDLLFSSYI